MNFIRYRSFYRTCGLRDHKGDRNTINLFGDISKDISQEKVSELSVNNKFVHISMVSLFHMNEKILILIKY